jgi:hypothetical protein
MEAISQIKEAYTSIGEELSANLSIIGENEFFVGGVPAIELQRVTWDGLLSTGRIVKFPEKERTELRGIYREISSLNQFLRLNFELATVPPSSTVQLGSGPIEERISEFPDPQVMKNLANVINAQRVRIIARIERLLIRWKAEGKVKQGE